MKKILAALTIPGLLLGGAAVAAAQGSDDTSTVTPPAVSDDTTTGDDDTTTEDGDHNDEKHASRGGRHAGMRFAEALDMTGAEFRDALQNGQTVAELAAAQGVDIDAVIADIVDEVQTKADANPDSPRAQNFDADALTEKLTAAVNGEIEPGDHGRRGPRMFAGGAIAEALGMDPSEIKAALKSGSTIADIATEQGVDIDAVIDQIVDEAQARADANPDSPRAQNFDADTLEQRLTDRVNREFEPGEREGRKFGPRWPHGPGAGGAAGGFGADA